MTPTGKNRPALAVGLLLIGLGAVWLALVHPLMSAYDELDTGLTEAGTLLAQYRAVAQQRALWKERSRELQAATASRAAYLEGMSDGAAGATVQRVVKQAVERAGGELQSTLVLPVRQDDGFRRVGVRAQMAGTVEALRAALLSLEGNQPMLFVEGVEIRTRQAQRAVPGKPAAEDRVLEIRLDVHGLALPAP